MNKTERLSYIENLIKQKSSGRLEANQSDIEEEKKLVPVENNSIEEEEDKAPFVNPALVEAMDKLRPQREEGEESFLLSAREKRLLSQELKKPVSFSGLKANVVAFQEDSKIDINKLDLNALLVFSGYETEMVG